MTSSHRPHPAELPVEQLLTQCDVRTGRRRGPGGQHRNKVETAVVITHVPTGVRAEASERRSQAQNKSQAVVRLRVNLALQVRSPRQREGCSPLWQSRCRNRRLSVSETHDDFPALLAEALDILNEFEMDMPKAATRLRVSASQLVKLLKLEPRALRWVNQQRQRASLRPLK